MASTTGIGIDTALADKFLKEFYFPGWTDLENNLTTTKKLFRRRQVPLRGRRAVIALRVGRTGGVQAIAPSAVANLGAAAGNSGAATLPVPGYQPVDNAYVKPKILMFAIGIPQDTIDVSTGDRASFMDTVDFEMMGAKTDAANYEDLTCYKGGATLGIADITSVIGAAPSTGIVVDNSYPFYKGKKIAFYATAGGFRDSAVVTAVNHATRTITFTSATASTVLATDSVVTRGARPETTTGSNDLYNFEPWGLDVMVDTANPVLKDLDGATRYLSVDRTALPEWQSTVVDCAGAFTYGKAQQVLDEIHELSGGDPTVALTTRATRRGIAIKMAYGTATEAGLTHTRFNDSIKTKGGLVAYSEDKHGQEADDWMRLNDEIPFVLDRYASHDYATSKGTIFFLDTRHIYEAVVTDWKWWAPEGRILREAATQGTFGLIAHAYRFFERVLDAPNTCGKLYNITV
jgi:hypothetical protein